MKLSHLVAVLAGLAAAAVLAADASAMYHPTAGRFMQRDPIGYAGGRNLYEYAASDPISEQDATGTGPCSDTYEKTSKPAHLAQLIAQMFTQIAFHTRAEVAVFTKCDHLDDQCLTGFFPIQVRKCQYSSCNRNVQATVAISKDLFPKTATFVFVWVNFKDGKKCHKYLDWSWEPHCDCECVSKVGEIDGGGWAYLPNAQTKWHGLTFTNDPDNPSPGSYGGRIDGDQIRSGDVEGILDGIAESLPKKVQKVINEIKRYVLGEE